ncbi:MAG: acyl-CoA dehydrogenase family protein [Planctomycetaceae bacterium]|nr:acyl-CoA dehydrogenase family protein [Planctomycetaceae bacterium]
MASFFQDGPQLGNQYDDDRALRDGLRRRLPADVLAALEPDLRAMGARTISEIIPLGNAAEAQPPRLVPYDPWGRRIDQIDVAPAWTALERIAAEEGLVAIGYERRQAEWSRLYQFVKLYLFGPSSATYTCPLAMADGAARAIEVHGDAALKSRAYRHLTTRDPGKFWTSGQWMTERPGGSDVGRTETVARRDANGYGLYGTKWFTSATTSQMALTLARIEDAHGNAATGSRGLSLFYLETRNPSGQLDRILIHRLKDKLGTKALPTAELSLEGTRAQLVGQPGDGVRNIAAMINVTRIHNVMGAVSGMRRAIALARDYAGRREAFGKLLNEHPLHVETLAGLQAEFEGGLALFLHLLELMGREECGRATAEQTAVLRLLTPVAKLYTAKQAIAVTSEVLESFGGAGYVEDTGLPRMLRDAQVLSIWEGTTNILSLDALRAIEKEKAFEPWLAQVTEIIERLQHPGLEEPVARIRHALQRISRFLPKALEMGEEVVMAGARGFAFSLARTTIAALLAQQAEWSMRTDNDGRALLAVLHWLRQDLAPLVYSMPHGPLCMRALALDEAAPLPEVPAEAAH